jgi:ion channel-forming bestrophin family protein
MNTNRFYTRHTTRFLDFWLILVPLGLYEPFRNSWNHYGMIPASVILSFFLLGINELSIQLEEPFSVLPQHAISNSIGKGATETVEWRKTDYDRMVDAYEKGLR